jgi:hypothetical protein
MSEEKSLRYGISALDMKYLQYAENDELMVVGETGRIVYKRSDGQIVTYEDTIYNDRILAISIADALNKANAFSPTDESASTIVYQTVSLAQKLSILDGVKFNLEMNSKFISNGKAGGFFYRIGANSNICAIIRYLETVGKMYGDSPSAKITFGIYMNENENTEQEFDITYSSFNSLVYVNVSPPEDAETYTIVLKGIDFTAYKEVYDALDSAEMSQISQLNYGNSRFEVNNFDIVTYNSDMTKVALCDETDGMRLVNILPVEFVEESTTGSGSSFAMSVDQPDITGLWAKITE